MEIKILRRQKIIKETLFKVENLELKTQISVTLTKYEKDLIEKYFDPVLTYSEIYPFLEPRPSSEESIISYFSPNLSKFSITGFTQDGFKRLGLIQNFEDAVIKLLKEKINYLKELENWDDTKIVMRVGENAASNNQKDNTVEESTPEKKPETGNISIADLLNEIDEK